MVPKKTRIPCSMGLFKGRTPFEKLEGFYGLIGPDIQTNRIKSIYDLFMGNGHIQGIFFERGKPPTFVKTHIHTEKFLYEQENGPVPNHYLSLVWFSFWNKFKLAPNIVGIANTALIHRGKHTYALFERDLPYLLDIDFQKKSIETIGKVRTNDTSIRCFSGHSKWINDTIESIHYDIINQEILYFRVQHLSLEVIQKHRIKMRHTPIVHDFVRTSLGNVVFTDSPLAVDLFSLFQGKISMYLDKKHRTWIHLLDPTSGLTREYKLPGSYHLFHYGKAFENETHIQIYASLYDHFHFRHTELKGRWRRIDIDKRTNETAVFGSMDIERFNLDFPVFYKDMTILRNIENQIMNGFVIVQNLTVIKTVFYENAMVCGEPVVVLIENRYYLLFYLVSRKDTHSVALLDLKTYKTEYMDLEGASLTIGFHSLFLLPPI